MTLFLAMASTPCVACAACVTYVTYAAYVAASITHFVSVEVIEGLISTRRMWTLIAVMWIGGTKGRLR